MNHKEQELKVKKIACKLPAEPRDEIQNCARSNENNYENFEDGFCHTDCLLVYLLHFRASRISFLPVCNTYDGHDYSTQGDQGVDTQGLLLINVVKLLSVLACSFTVSPESVGT